VETEVGGVWVCSCDGGCYPGAKCGLGASTMIGVHREGRLSNISLRSRL
jgi:hypothetical protein